MKFKFHPAALDEYEESIRYYRERDPAIADRFIEIVERTIADIVETPDRWRFVEADVRRCLTRVFPYGILYSIETDYVLVLAIMHCSREPGYWKTRSPQPGPPSDT